MCAAISTKILLFNGVKVDNVSCSLLVLFFLVKKTGVATL